MQRRERLMVIAKLGVVIVFNGDESVAVAGPLDQPGDDALDQEQRRVGYWCVGVTTTAEPSSSPAPLNVDTFRIDGHPHDVDAPPTHLLDDANRARVFNGDRRGPFTAYVTTRPCTPTFARSR